MLDRFGAQSGLYGLFDPQEQGGFETPGDSGALTNFVEIGQARDKVLSLKLDQVVIYLCPCPPRVWEADFALGIRNIYHLWIGHINRPQRLSHITRQPSYQDGGRDWRYQTRAHALRFSYQI